MKHSVVFSQEPFKSAGLPFSVVVLESREVLGAFKEEGPAMTFRTWLDEGDGKTGIQQSASVEVVKGTQSGGTSNPQSGTIPLLADQIPGRILTLSEQIAAATKK